MKIKFIILVVLILLFAGFIGVRFFLADTQNSAGRIKILSTPSAAVFIDNVAVGKTPYDEKQKVGEYMVKLIPEGDATATASWQGKVKVYKNALTYINRELGSSDITSAGEIFTIQKISDVADISSDIKKPKNPDSGAINVESEPTGAIVYLDNDEKGVAPLILSEIPKGDHEISIFMPGFFRRTQKVNVVPGYIINASFKLAIDQSQQQKLDTNASDSAKLSTDKSSSTSAATTTPTPKTSTSSSTGKTVLIKDTPTGYLRVREEPSTSASESAQVKPGDTFPYIDQDQNGDWYKIEYEKGKQGWVSSQYAEKQ